jgi:hypothetical protein
VIGSDQIVPLALALFGVLGIRVDDELSAGDEPDRDAGPATRSRQSDH